MHHVKNSIPWAGLGFGVWGLGFGVWGLGFKLRQRPRVWQENDLRAHVGTDNAAWRARGRESLRFQLCFQASVLPFPAHPCNTVIIESNSIKHNTKFNKTQNEIQTSARENLKQQTCACASDTFDVRARRRRRSAWKGKGGWGGVEERGHG